jgi:site-specific DNA recombinase
VAQIPTPRKCAVVYCRVSTDKQEQDGASLDYQEEKCCGYARLRGIDVIVVLKEAKSGFIHYSHREQLTLARQFIRDKMTDVIIVWDLRRFSRNFVHSAMIFEEIESNGGEILSVSENIDNSLTGKLIRSILAWSAESEREKIVEYANRHWQARLEHNLPVATGRAPYGWEWGDRDKTYYVVNPEEAAVRFSIFHMFVEEDMSIRGIAHKLTEDGILPPAKSRGANVRSTAWQLSTVHLMLTDGANIGVLRILKSKKVLTARGTDGRQPNENMKTIVDGLPPLIPLELYERAQRKIATNKSDKSPHPRNPEDFLLREHVYCKTCNYRMAGRYLKSRRYTYAYYSCVNQKNKYDCCPSVPFVRTERVDEWVWADCCRVFERLDMIRDTLMCNIEQSLHTMLEDTKGRQLIDQLTEEITYARQERTKHAEGSYYFRLISQDIQEKEERLQKYEEQYREARGVLKLSDIYQRRVMAFLDFLSTMKGHYHEAAFQDKRTALDVLDVKVYIHPDTHDEADQMVIESAQEWFAVGEAAELIEISKNTLLYHIKAGTLQAEKRPVPLTVIHRDEVENFVAMERRNKTREIDLDDVEGEWFTINSLVALKLANYSTIHRAIRVGDIQTHTKDVLQQFIHRDELNRFLRETPVRPRSERENLTSRVEIAYSPLFTGVQHLSDSAIDMPSPLER